MGQRVYAPARLLCRSLASLLMRQFDVFHNPDRREAAFYPCIAVLQSDLVYNSDGVVSAPFGRRSPANSRLYPVFQIEGEPLTLMVPELGAFPRTALDTAIA